MDVTLFTSKCVSEQPDRVLACSINREPGYLLDFGDVGHAQVLPIAKLDYFPFLSWKTRDSVFHTHTFRAVPRTGIGYVLPLHIRSKINRGGPSVEIGADIARARIEVSKGLAFSLVKSPTPYKAEKDFLSCVLGIFFGRKTSCAVAEHLVIVIFCKLLGHEGCFRRATSRNDARFFGTSLV